MIHVRSRIFTIEGVALCDVPKMARPLLGFYWLTVLVLAAVYAGNLTASLAVQKLILPIQTLEDLAAQDDIVLTLGNGSPRMQLFRVRKAMCLYQMHCVSLTVTIHALPCLTFSNTKNKL